MQSALDEQGIEYEVIKRAASCARIARRPRARSRASGQYPVIEFEDGSVYREESKDMAATIRAGKLDEKRAGAAAG